MFLFSISFVETLCIIFINKQCMMLIFGFLVIHSKYLAIMKSSLVNFCVGTGLEDLRNVSLLARNLRNDLLVQVRFHMVSHFLTYLFAGYICLFLRMFAMVTHFWTYLFADSTMA